MKMIVKTHKTHDGRRVIAVCDSEILGKKFEDKGMQLDLSCSFYKGDEKTDEELLEELKRPGSVNIVGEKSIKFFVERGLIDKNSVIRIKNVPHAQCVLMG
ncbi:hypothetical protein COV19_00655 [Candidatus Woesearchaeota archaeon CG10_big_fil_rev_8_21_14_0_10_44_13]|nr:MAG: hypothetical protein COV19_00655 [Candidatus Woesearchaeota archaeon CG10_big_fil_rev_8_21_14_0_10_44_13]